MYFVNTYYVTDFMLNAEKIKKNKIQSLPLEVIITFEQKPTTETKHTTKQSQ